MFEWLGKLLRWEREPKCFHAYAHLYYECNECGKAISVWNSRDGAAPLLISCPMCKRGVMMHVKWNLDVVERHYKLKPGDYFFRDGTLHDAWRTAKKASRQEATQEEIEQMVRQLMDDGGWPVLDRVPPYSAA